MTKILIDSSSWIHFFNETCVAQHGFVASVLKEDRGVTCGPVLTEVMRGARNDKERASLKDYFSVLDYRDLLQEDFLDAADLGFSLRRKGLTVKTMDLLIARVAMKHRLILVHDDGDFEFIARHAPLEALRPRA